jgi:hypothetical protein
MKTSETHAAALQRFEAAKEERDRRVEQFDAAKGSTAELPASAELSAADDQFAAREAWLKWVERDH